jgi:VanZ family protein
MKQFVSRWVPLIAWMVFIFVGSTDLLSGEHTSRFIVPFLLWLDPHMSHPALVRMNILIRKLGHITEYAILAALLWRALGPTIAKRRFRLAGLALLLASAYAGLDEFHQSFVRSRTSSPNDVAIDILGAVVAIALCLMIGRSPAVAQDRHGVAKP